MGKTPEQSRLARQRYRAKYRRQTDRNYEQSEKGKLARKGSSERLKREVAEIREETLQSLGGRCAT